MFKDQINHPLQHLILLLFFYFIFMHYYFELSHAVNS